MTIIKQASLYFTEGSSDKEYHAQMKERDSGYVVDYQNGKRGSALRSGTKTEQPVSYDEAMKIWTKLVESKKKGGYTEDVSGAIFQDVSATQTFTGYLPQLLNPIDADEVDRYLNDDEWFMEQKFDGDRRSMKIAGAGANGGAGSIGINKKGMQVALPLPLADAVASLGRQMFVDGELIGDIYYVFDLLEIDGQDLRQRGAEQRYDLLVQTMDGLAQDHRSRVIVVEIARDTASKKALFDRVQQAGLEGVVFKHKASPYVPDRPASGGDQIKFKFWESATLEVVGTNGSKRSVALQGYDDAGAVVSLGSVTIPSNKAIPQAGEIVEVKYLYAYKNGSIYQPEYLGVRMDQDRADCKISQLKYKSDAHSV